MKKAYLLLLAVLLALLFAVPSIRADDDVEAAAAADDDAEAVPVPEDELVKAGFSEEQAAEIKGGEKFEFQAEVSRLMDIIINSLYSNREIFLRELISNASDALDKIRFAALTDKGVLGDDGDDDLNIEVEFDKKANTLTVRDRGVGMTRDDLVNHLGVVASSGTTRFAEAAAAGAENALQLIGQFGVGFYSVYLVADQVTVASKHNDDEDQHIWVSKADGHFTVSKDPRGSTLGRGSEVTLYLKEDAREFLDQSTLERVLQKYSQFINFPIMLRKVKTVSKEVPLGTDEEEAAANAAQAAKDLEENPLPPGVGDDFDTDELEGLAADVAEADKAREAAAADAGEDAGASDDDSASAGDDDLLEALDEDDEDAIEKDDKPKTKTIQVEEVEWERMNADKAIWTRSPSEVTEEEYQEFYQTLTKDSDGSLVHNHFRAEGEISFKSLMYVPAVAAHDLYDKYYGKSTGLKLYVRRVLIAEEFDEFMPRYLNFIKGVVDSDDLPLNVSRETLSKSRVLRVMGKKLTRKALAMLQKLSRAEEEWIEEVEGDDDEEEEEAEEADADADDAEDAEAAKAERKAEGEKYGKFWSQYGKSIKLGVIEDSANRNKLVSLLRYRTSKSGEEVVSLQRYVDRMAEDQKYIYYITGENLETVSKSPFLEQLRNRDYEVVYMVDPLDEYTMNTVQDFGSKKFMSVTKEGFKLDESSEAKDLEKKLKKAYEPFAEWLEGIYGDRVEKVQVSKRIAESPCVLVTSQYGWSANMERIMKAQTFSDAEKNQYMMGKKTLEINPRHPLIRELRQRSAANPDDEGLRDLAGLMFDAALVNSGFSVDNGADFASRIHRVVANGIDVESATEILSDDDLATEVEAEIAVIEAAEAAERAANEVDDEEEDEAEAEDVEEDEHDEL